jgi:amino acid permease
VTRLRKIISSTLFAVAFMCIGVSFIVFCVFHNKTHDVILTAEIGVPGAILIAILAVFVYPGRLPVPGGR